MAGLRAVAQTAEVALAAATAKTIIQIVAPGNQRLLVGRWGVFFDGIDPLAQPVEVVLMKQTTAGTMSALTPVRITPGSETLQGTAQYNATVEPTSSSIVDMCECHPQSGYEAILPLGEEIQVAGGERLAVVVTSPSVINVRAKIYWQE